MLKLPSIFDVKIVFDLVFFVSGVGQFPRTKVDFDFFA